MGDGAESERFPIGKFHRLTAAPGANDRAVCIETIATTPAKIRRLVEPLSPAELDTPYRDGGWTIRQVVHHVPDSHINAYVRFKLALTETDPVIKPYEEALWAELADVRQTPVSVSLDLLDAVHYRWVVVLRSMDDAAFNRSYRHPEMGHVTLYNALALYDWHSRHHVAHIEQALRRK
jgi:hypothetical protein